MDTLIKSSEIIRLLTFALFTAYIIGVRKYDITSISQSDYRLKHFKYLFEIVMFMAGIAIALSSVQIDKKVPSILLQVGGVLIFGVGLFPKYKKNQFNEFMHLICAGGGFLVTAVALMGIFWPIGLFIAIVMFAVDRLVKSDGNRVLTLELVMSYIIFISLELIALLY